MVDTLYGRRSLNTARARCSYVSGLVRFGRLEEAVAELDAIDAGLRESGAAGDGVRKRVQGLRERVAARRR